MKSIGGYFELELIKSNCYHPKGIELNTARNAFEYVLKARKYKKVYIPYFTCEVLLEPIIKLKVDYEFYHINQSLEPIFDYRKLSSESGFLYTNYFGQKDAFSIYLASKISNLIIDNAQSFFSKPIENIDTFYSPRKFLGVADGAYLFCNKQLYEDFDFDVSNNRMSHLLIRADETAEKGYSFFCDNDRSLNNQPIKRMSKLTSKILHSLDYDLIKRKRIENFNYLHQFLKESNLLNLELNINQIPFVYPLWTKDSTRRKILLHNKIYTATYWPNVKNYCKKNDLEFMFTDEIIPLPIDQRYGIKEMEFIKNLFLNG